jgi:hypothetical protein
MALYCLSERTKRAKSLADSAEEAVRDRRQAGGTCDTANAYHLLLCVMLNDRDESHPFAAVLVSKSWSMLSIRKTGTEFGSARYPR